MWWVFPAHFYGGAEPPPPTRIANEREALEYLQKAQATTLPSGETLLQLWIDIITSIREMPKRDKPRAEGFAQQWRSYAQVRARFPAFANAVDQHMDAIIRCCRR